MPKLVTRIEEKILLYKTTISKNIFVVINPELLLTLLQTEQSYIM